MRIWIIFLIFLSSLIACNHAAPERLPMDKAQNVILLIGDGMGLAQISSRYYYHTDQEPNFSRFRYIGLHQPQPSDKKITDSAAGATAFSTGFKTFNKAIGLDADSVARPTILEIAHQKGKSTGLIVTSSITHATPASFFAHVPHRDSHERIALQMVHAPFDLVAGGGLKYFSNRMDQKNLLGELVRQGVEVDTVDLKPNLDPEKRYAFLLGKDSLLSKTQGRDDYLSKATRLALKYLPGRSKNGFFLMVEGSQIDWGGHDNVYQTIVEEVKDFDDAIGVALDFAEKDKNTLVIVTADHETGGFALSGYRAFGKADYGNILPTFSTGDHTASLIPVFAYGPGAEDFIGIYQNNAIFAKMIRAFGFTDYELRFTN